MSGILPEAVRDAVRIRVRRCTWILAALLLVLMHVNLWGSASPTNIRSRLLGCALLPRQEATACLEGLQEKQEIGPACRGAVSNLLKHFRDETGVPKREEATPALLVFTPDLNLGDFKGRKIRGGPYVLELGVEPDGTISSIRPKSESTGLRTLDQHLKELAGQCVVVPEIRDGAYVRCTVTVVYYIDAR